MNYKNTQNSIPQSSNDASIKENQDSNIKFDLVQTSRANKPSAKSISKPQQGDSFKVRFLGSMNVKADRGNDYINETIRRVMGARASHNVFKLSEFNIVINSESISLFSVPSDKDAEKMTEDLLSAKFEISELAFWCPHKDNERLFGFIIKEPNQSLRFKCHVFESDVNSTVICETITQATKIAFQLLIVRIF